MTTLVAPIRALAVAFVLNCFAPAKSPQAMTGASSPKSIPEARVLLKRVLLAEDQVPFQGTQTVVFASGQNSEATITSEAYLAGNRSRIQYRLPRTVAGKVIVSNGSMRWEYDPQKRLMTRSVSSWKPMTFGNAAKIYKRIAACYTLKVLPAMSTVSGRPTFALEFTSRRGDRRRQLWWIDQATSIVLKREVYEMDGVLHSASTYSAVRFLPSPKTSDIELRAPPGVRTVTREKPVPLVTVHEARDSAPAWASVQDRLGLGFYFESAVVTTVQGNPTVHLQYSDGLVGISLVQMAGKAHLHEGGGPVRTVKIGNAEGRLIRHSRFRILSWSLPGRSLSLVADLPETTLVSVARGLR